MIWLLYMVCVILLNSRCTASTSSFGLDCPPVCTCRGSTAVCGEKDFGLTEIPSLPENIRRFIFLNGNIPLVNRKVLSPVSKCRLLSMTLRSDNITRLSSDAFTDFTVLQKLDLSGNRIPANMLRDAFRNLSNRLQSIVLRSMGIAALPRDMFLDLKDHIVYIDLSDNILEHVFDNDSLLHGLSVLSQLNISYNSITFFSSSNANLRGLHLNNNWLTEIPDFCLSNGSARYKGLEKVDLGGNSIQSLDNSSFSCLENVKYLYLGHSGMKVLPNNTFKSMKNLKVLQMSHQELTKIDELAFYSDSLLDLDLSHNYRLSSITFPGNLPFQWAPKLSKLNLQNTHLDMLPASSLSEMFSQLKAVKKLDLQNTKLKALPASLSEMHKLEALILATNHLATWNSTTFANLTHLKYINLNKNGIRLINETSFPFETRASLKTVNLGNNDFLCTCELQWFRTWMTEVIKNKTVKFVKYPESYWCAAPKSLRLDKYNPTYAECHNYQSNAYIIACAVIGCFLLLLLVALVVVYRCRWRLRSYIYSKPQHQRLSGRDEQFVYDAFVAYCDDDSYWVINELVQFLETNHNIKLCIHQRDFVPGRLAVDNIRNFMEKSKRVILIVSNDFARSEWCQFETRMALNMEKQVIVVVRETVSTRNLFKPLRTLLANPGGIQWQDGQERCRLCLLHEVNKNR
ncbi:toll-like receptor 13 [Gigantopelta aegis]|uniref:toll-like receptor 13 n=1 Tax=Gigantopelta aegis TaxID=1735272 RepID=UPI001B88D431|nr:toll-like receptor 13 [Gigantopelta aegis]